MPRGPAKERFVLYLPGKMLDLLDRAAEQTGIEKAEIIRSAIDLYFTLKQLDDRRRAGMLVNAALKSARRACPT